MVCKKQAVDITRETDVFFVKFWSSLVVVCPFSLLLFESLYQQIHLWLLLNMHKFEHYTLLPLLTNPFKPLIQSDRVRTWAFPGIQPMFHISILFSARKGKQKDLKSCMVTTTGCPDFLCSVLIQLLTTKRDWAPTVLSAKWLTIIIFTQQIRLYDNCFSQMSPHSPLFWHLFKFNAKQKLPWFGLSAFILLIYLFLSRNEIIWFM